MEIGSIYAQLEEKWYAFLDAFDSKGIPVYKLVDPIENAGIPSLPLFVGVLIILIALVVYSMGGVAPVGEFTVSVADADGNAVKSANIAIILDAETLFEELTNSKGEAYFSLAPDTRYQAEISTELCGDTFELIDTAEMDILEVIVQCVSPEFAGCSLLSEDKLVTQLTDDDNQIPSACTMRVYDSVGDAIDHPFEVTSDGLFDISEGGSCPEDDNRVLLDCQYHKWEGTVAGMYNELNLFGQLTLAVKSDVVPDDPVTPVPVEITRTIYVKAQNTEGTPLEGIDVQVVDATGDPLQLYFEDITTEGATDATGTAEIVLPDQQEFHLKLEDPNGAYQGYTSASSYRATLTQSQNPIILNLASGFETIFYIKEEARQTAIDGATVTVYSDDRVISKGTTGSDGQYVVMLLKGMQYRVNVNHPLYYAASAEVAGDVDQSIFMAPIDETKTGTVVVDVFNAHGLQEEFRGVKLKMYSQNNNTLWMSCVTPADGRCYFDKIRQGTYYMTATPPGAINPQAFTAFQVVPQNMTVQTLRIVPNQLVLTVLTQVRIDDRPIRKKDVEVTLWNADYHEAVETQESGSTRKVEFTMDQGTRYFLVAEYVDETTGTKYGPLQTSPAVMSQNRKTTLTLTRVREEAGVLLPAEIAKGTEENVKLRLSLPEYRPGQMYKSASIEMFVGEPGAVDDITRTPIVIQPIYLADLASQEPFVSSIEKADEYNYDSDPEKDDEEVSKYIKLNIGKYTKPTMYEADIPIYARDLAKNDDVKVSYKASWTPPSGEPVTSNEGLWSETSIKIVGEAEVNKDIETGDFYSYDAYFTKQLDGEAVDDPKVPAESLFYLRMSAKARSAIQAWSVDVNNLPDKVEAVSYSGKILKATGTSVNIAEFPLTGSDFVIDNDEGAYALGKDDELQLVIALRAKERGKGTLTLFSDYDNSLAYEVTRKARSGSTPIAGVTATMTAASNFCIVGYDNGLTQTDACYFEYAEDLTLPTNNKDFRLVLELGGNATANVLIEAADTSIRFDKTNANYYEDVVDAPTSIVIDGRGSSVAANTMNVFIWEAGSTKPNNPWYMVTYGPVDYSMQVTPLDDHLVETTFSESTDEVQVKIVQKDGTTEKVIGVDVLEDNQASVVVGGLTGKATLIMETEPYFEYKVDELNPLEAEDGVKVTAESPLFGKLIFEDDVSGLIFEPAYPKLLFESPLALGTSDDDTVTIRSSWKEPVAIEVGALQRDGYDILTTVRTYSSGNVLLDTLSGSDLNNVINIPTEGRVEIIIAATAKTAKCRLDLAPTILEIEIDKLPTTPHYTLGLSCIVEGVPDIEAIDVVNFVAREKLSPARVTLDSCSVATDGGYAFVCDTEQFSVAVAKAADELLLRPTAISDSRHYAIGKDEFAAAIMDTAVKENSEGISRISNVLDRQESALQTSTNDIVVNGKPGCGIVQVNFTKIHLDEDVNVTFLTNTDGATWCQKNHPHYAIGLMNFDKSLRPDFGYYMSFAGDSNLFLEGIAKAREQGNDIDADLLFGYEPESEDRAGSQAATMFTYRECERKSSDQCPSFAVKRVSDQHPIIGYYHVTERDDILIGMVYDENKIVGAGGAYTQIPQYRMVFVKAIMNYILKGESSGWLAATGNFQSVLSAQYYPLGDQLLDLTGPEIVEDSFRLYGFTPDGVESEELVGTTSINAELKVTGDPAFCILSNIDASGQPIDEVQSDQLESIYEDTFVLAIPWELTSGSSSKLVGAFCVDANGIPSHKVRARIMLDDTAMSLVRPLPRLISTHAPVTRVPKFDDTFIQARDRFSDITYCELRLTGDEMPNIEVCDDNNDGLFNAQDNFDNNANADASGKIPKTDIDGHKDGCCIVTPETVDIGYYKYSNIECWSPYIGEVDQATEMELVCNDASGNEASLGTTSIWRYSDETPQFDVPDDFIMSTDEVIDARDYTFWFDKDAMPSGRQGLIQWSGFEFRSTDNPNEFKFSFAVSDNDGIDPNSGCTVKIDEYEKNYLHTLARPAESERGVAEAGGDCTGEAIDPGTLREMKMTCPLELSKDKAHIVQVICSDLALETGTNKQEFDIVWDETGPQIENFRMGRYGKITGQAFQDNPPMNFELKDNYSRIKGCEVRVELIGDADTVFPCSQTPVYNEETGVPNYQHVEMLCRADENSTLAGNSVPLLGIDWEHVDQTKIYCWDKVENIDLKQSAGSQSIKESIYMDSTQIAEMVLDACKILRTGVTSEGIIDRGFNDNSADDVGDGSVAIVDKALENQIDREGVTFLFYHNPSFQDGEFSWDAVKNKYKPWQETAENKIKRHAECGTQAVCLTMIDLISFQSIQHGLRKSGGERAKYRMKDAIRWGFSRKVGHSTKVLENYAKTFVKTVAMRKYTTAAWKTWLKYGVRSSIYGAARIAKEADDCLQTDPAFAEKLSYASMVPLPFTGTVGSLAELFVPDDFELNLCKPEVMDEGVYIVTATAEDANLEGYLDAVLKPFEACFAACDEFTCQVAIQKLDIEEEEID